MLALCTVQIPITVTLSQYEDRLRGHICIKVGRQRGGRTANRTATSRRQAKKWFLSPRQWDHQ